MPEPRPTRSPSPGGPRPRSATAPSGCRRPRGTLAMTSAPLAPRGLFDATPTVLAMRALPVDPELVCDLVVEAAALGGGRGRLLRHRAARHRPRARPGPGSRPRAADGRAVGRSPRRCSPRARSGGSRRSPSRAAESGRGCRARGPRERSGVRPTMRSDGLPLGVAFAAFTLGFIVGEEDARVLRADRRPAASRGRVVTSCARGHDASCAAPARGGHSTGASVRDRAHA